jgi:hypothetical protein
VLPKLRKQANDFLAIETEEDDEEAVTGAETGQVLAVWEMLDEIGLVWVVIAGTGSE